jgi:hypothetical protein
MKPITARQQLHTMINHLSVKEVLELIAELCDEGAKNNPGMKYSTDAVLLREVKEHIHN